METILVKRKYFKFDRNTTGEALLGVNYDKRHGLEIATREPRNGHE